jgi:phosphatidylglycerophosphate synthase
MLDFDVVLLANSPHARTHVLGLSLVERGWRVAERAGAKRVFIVDSVAAANDLRAWAESSTALIVMRVGDQVVHKPLLDALVAGTGQRRIVVGADGTYGGAVWASGPAIKEAVDTILASPKRADEQLHERWKDAEVCTHGEIARHPATTPEEQRGAVQMMLRILIKKEDNPVTKYCYRPLSRPLTRVLVHTPITPNQISYIVGVLGLLGCYMTALPSQACLIWGAVVIFFAGVLDGCDGEIARLKLISTPFGAWLDTIVDEITTTGYYVAIACHMYAHYPRAWIGWSIPVGALLLIASIYVIYYFCIVVAKVGGSQFYIGTLELVEGPRGWGLREKKRAQTIQSPLLRMLGRWGMYMKTRDFINLAALFLTFLNAYEVIYTGMLVGTIVTAMFVLPDHLRLRMQLRELARRGGTPYLVAS